MKLFYRSNAVLSHRSETCFWQRSTRKVPLTDVNHFISWIKKEKEYKFIKRSVCSCVDTDSRKQLEESSSSRSRFTSSDFTHDMFVLVSFSWAESFWPYRTDVIARFTGQDYKIIKKVRFPANVRQIYFSRSHKRTRHQVPHRNSTDSLRGFSQGLSGYVFERNAGVDLRGSFISFSLSAGFFFFTEGLNLSLSGTVGSGFQRRCCSELFLPCVILNCHIFLFSTFVTFENQS